MEFLNQILPFIQQNQQTLIFLFVAYLVLTKRIDVSFLLNLFKPVEPKPPVQPPADPTTPRPLDLRTLIEQLLPILLKAKADGDADTEHAILHVMGKCPHCTK